MLLGRRAPIRRGRPRPGLSGATTGSVKGSKPHDEERVRADLRCERLSEVKSLWLPARKLKACNKKGRLVPDREVQYDPGGLHGHHVSH
jgi:hypothetical protein